MKYRQLTKEQLESLHEEFARFLASQSIDKKEWEQLKKEKPNVAEDEINVFSDVVWDDVLTRTSYVEHFSPKTINLFKCENQEMKRLVVKVDKEINLQEQVGYEWLLKNPNDDAIEYLQGTKKYQKERNIEVFDLIEKGGNISKGELFEYFNRLISK